MNLKNSIKKAKSFYEQHLLKSKLKINQPLDIKKIRLNEDYILSCIFDCNFFIFVILKR